MHMYSCIRSYTSSTKEILPFTIRWIRLEDIISKISQTQKEKYYMISYMGGIQKDQIHRDRLNSTPEEVTDVAVRLQQLP